MVRRGLTSERLIGLFLLALLLFMPPLIGVFDRLDLVGGIPVLYLYLFVAWAGLIVLLALIVEQPQSEDDLAQAEPATMREGERDRTTGAES